MVPGSDYLEILGPTKSNAKLVAFKRFDITTVPAGLEPWAKEAKKSYCKTQLDVRRADLGEFPSRCY